MKALWTFYGSTIHDEINIFFIQNAGHLSPKKEERQEYRMNHAQTPLDENFVYEFDDNQIC